MIGCHLIQVIAAQQVSCATMTFCGFLETSEHLKLAGNPAVQLDGSMVNFLHEEDGEVCNKCDHVGFVKLGKNIV